MGSCWRLGLILNPSPGWPVAGIPGPDITYILCLFFSWARQHPLLCDTHVCANDINNAFCFWFKYLLRHTPKEKSREDRFCFTWEHIARHSFFGRRMRSCSSLCWPAKHSHSGRGRRSTESPSICVGASSQTKTRCSTWNILCSWRRTAWGKCHTDWMEC